MLALTFVASVSALAMSGDIAGKRCVVTGASGGIGAAIAVALGSRGCRVVLHYNTREAGVLETARRVREAGGTVDACVRADFRSPAAVEGLWKHVDDVWDGVDVLVNNAGVVTKRAASEGSFDAWDATLNVNLHAPYKLACGAKARMPNDGCIVMMSSVHGQRSVEWMSAYAASKAALDSLTRSLSVEWAPIRVVGVAPGPVPVERTAARMMTDEVQDLWRPHLPLGTMGHVDQIADATLWLIESQASAWVTGQTITLDGGMSARTNMPIRPRPADVAVDQPLDHHAVLLNEEARLVAPKVPTTVAEARDAAAVAAATYGPASPEVVDALSVVDEMEARSGRVEALTTLADECDVDATADKCQQLAQDLRDLEELMKKGPPESRLKQITRDLIREIEESYKRNKAERAKRRYN